MRYQCRPAGKPAFYDTKYPGTYNAPGHLECFWKAQFGSRTASSPSTPSTSVSREGNNVVLEFRPQPPQDMLVACLWSHWSEPGQPELLSFAAITDEPPAEIAAAGHDRCIIPIRPENIDAWLKPDRTSLREQYAILDDRPSQFGVPIRIYGARPGRPETPRARPQPNRPFGLRAPDFCQPSAALADAMHHQLPQRSP
jgi:hypothetical protein